MQISEVFESIQGEGPWIGYPATFVRLYGCNLNCSFCDSQYSRNGSYSEWSVEAVARAVFNRNQSYVIFTGGEPCMQWRDLEKAVKRIRDIAPDKKIAIETNGTFDFDNTIFDIVVVSPKSMSVLDLWTHRPNVYIKFLAVDENDIEGIRRRMNTNVFANIPYIMPIGITAEQIIATGKEIADLIVASGMDAVLSPRLHILMGAK